MSDGSLCPPVRKTIVSDKMKMRANLDCVVVGYNDSGFQKTAKQQEPLRDRSGGYHELLIDSVLLHGERMPYMDLLNHCLSKAHGQQSNLHVTELPALSGCYLKNYLCKRNLNVEIVNSFTYDQDQFRDLLSQSPNAIAITTTFYVDNAPLIEIIDFTRRHNPSTKIIVGGPHIFNLCSYYDSLTLPRVLAQIGADIYIFDSQGEFTLSQVLLQLRDSQTQDLRNIPNLFYKHDKTFRGTKRVIENNDMDQNSIDWQGFQPEFIVPTAMMRTARSCAFKCAFCSYPAVAGALNLMSLDVIETELQRLQDSGVRNIIFIDDTFNVPLPRFKKICRLLANYDFQWFSYFRCSNSDDEALDLMEKNGCKGVFLGIESGAETILNNMDKYAKVEKYVDSIHKLNARGIMSHASLIVGFPGETEATVKNTIDFINEASPTFFRAGLFWYDTQVNVPVREKAGIYGLQNEGFSWKHQTMDWKEACDAIQHVYHSVTNSIILPSYMFNFWAIPYLMGKGISLETIRRFADIAQEMLIPSLAEIPTDFVDQESRLVSLFQEPSAPTTTS